MNRTGLADTYNLTCTSLDWCYFKTDCRNVSDKLPDLTFTLGHGTDKAQFTMKPRNYIFSESNPAKKIENCHLAIIGQDFSTVDYWILGDIFNYNFYTSFDAENYPRIGLALQRGAGVGGQITPTPDEVVKPPKTHKALKNMLVVLIVIVIGTLLLYAVCTYQAKAKNREAAKRVAEYEQARKRLSGLGDEEDFVMSSGGNNNDDHSEPMIPQPKSRVSFSIFNDDST